MTTTTMLRAAELGWRFITLLPGETAPVQVWWTPLPDRQHPGNVAITVRDAVYYDMPDDASLRRSVSVPADLAVPVLNRTVSR